MEKTFKQTWMEFNNSSSCLNIYNNPCRCKTNVDCCNNFTRIQFNNHEINGNLSDLLGMSKLTFLDFSSATKIRGILETYQV